MHIVLASAIGAPMNPSKIANTFAGERQMIYSNKTISNHIDYLADDYIPDITPYTLFFPFPIQSHNLHHIVFETAFFLFPSLPSSPSHRCKNYSCFYIRCLSPL